MNVLVYQELSKLLHKKSTWLGAISIVLIELMFLLLHELAPKYFTESTLISNGYYGDLLVIFLMISSAASIIAMEYQYGTLKMLLSRQFSRLQVFVSKMLTIVIHLVTLQTLATVTNISLTLMAFPKYDLYQHLLKQFSETLGEVLMVLLLLSLVVLLATCFRSNAAAMASGFISYFGIQLIGSFLLLAIQHWEWLKWSPLTMMMFSAQIEEPQITRFTHLSTSALGIGATLYLIGFMMIAYLRFRKQPV